VANTEVRATTKSDGCVRVITLYGGYLTLLDIMEVKCNDNVVVEICIHNIF
jgi:hypothetical protein